MARLFSRVSNLGLLYLWLMVSSALFQIPLLSTCTVEDNLHVEDNKQTLINIEDEMRMTPNIMHYMQLRYPRANGAGRRCKPGARVLIPPGYFTRGKERTSEV